MQPFYVGVTIASILLSKRVVISSRIHFLLSNTPYIQNLGLCNYVQFSFRYRI